MITTIGIFAILLVFAGIILSLSTDNGYWFLFTVAGTILLVSLLIDLKAKIPTENDVLEGKAIYQETVHITNNDTVKTYKIVWKQKNQ